MAKYLLTIRVKMEAIDNLEAREKAKTYLCDVYGTAEFKDRPEELKLQELKEGKAPVKVEL